MRAVPWRGGGRRPRAVHMRSELVRAMSGGTGAGSPARQRRCSASPIFSRTSTSSASCNAARHGWATIFRRRAPDPRDKQSRAKYSSSPVSFRAAAAREAAALQGFSEENAVRRGPGISFPAAPRGCCPPSARPFELAGAAFESASHGLSNGARARPPTNCLRRPVRTDCAPRKNRTARYVAVGRCRG